jgi:cell division transport system permease protein
MQRILLRLFLQGIQDLRLNTWAQISAMAAVTLVCFLSGLFLMALVTLDRQLGMVRGETSFQVYWHQGTDPGQIREQWQGYTHIPGFLEVKTFTPEEALEELGKRLGRSSGSLEKGFPFLAEKSPLPATALLSFMPGSENPEHWLAQTKLFLESQPGVSRVVLTPLHDELGRAWRKVSNYVMWPSVSFLTLMLGLLVGNTIRLSLVARAHEIEILQLVGAFNWYIRMPLLVNGAFLSLVGGLLALGMLRMIHAQVYNVLNFPPLLMEIQFLSWHLALALVLAPTLMGIAASWLAVRNQ